MYLTKVRDPGGDDYRVHQYLMGIFDRQKILFQRKGFEIDVLSERGNADSQDVSGLVDGAGVGSTMLFTIRLNPVVTRYIDGKNRRVALESNRVRCWIEEVFGKNGFTAEFAIRDEGYRRSQRSSATVTLYSVLVTGVLTVVDPDLFHSAIRKGLGHGKGMGFGLLNVFGFR